MAKWHEFLPGAVAGGLVSAAISIGTFYYTDMVSHHRTAQMQTVLAFSDRGFPLAKLSGKYIEAIADKKPLDALRVEIRGAVMDETITAENLRSVLGSKASDVDSYQKALRDFAMTLDGADGPTHMREWTEAFGRTVDARQQLDKSLRAEIGV